MMYQNLDIQAKGKQAQLFYQQKKYKKAAHLFMEIAQAYLTTNQELKAAEMKNNASVSWLLAGEAQKALQASLATHTLFENNQDYKQAGIAYGNQAAAYDALNKTEEALAYYHKASEQLLLAGETEYRSIVLKQISELQLKTGAYYQALASMNNALNSMENISVKDNILQRFFKQIFK
jgi:tetratricopeptide (TPR) repeat protein